jgi:hypothetical protein
MKANRAYRLIHTREERAPAFLSSPDRLDRVEVVEIETEEIVLIWDLPPKQARRLARSLRADLAQLDAEQFLAAWQAVAEES